ncbi:unnamed protein product [Protopolystoma xenopodis]|uniref:Uncharacterized protein n=1 Tax=Protopolystoma xenopodis TaxID=117903 RepID=A0A3S5AW93_9PLAT|nr:unnamed protein product [Protopolystoma xenopodis]
MDWLHPITACRLPPAKSSTSTLLTEARQSSVASATTATSDTGEFRSSFDSTHRLGRELDALATSDDEVTTSLSVNTSASLSGAGSILDSSVSTSSSSSPHNWGSGAQPADSLREESDSPTDAIRSSQAVGFLSTASTGSLLGRVQRMTPRSGQMPRSRGSRLRWLMPRPKRLRRRGFSAAGATQGCPVPRGLWRRVERWLGQSKVVVASGLQICRLLKWPFAAKALAEYPFINSLIPHGHAIVTILATRNLFFVYK